jgi:hypothetical protein
MRPLVASGFALALALSTLAPKPVLAQEAPPADDGAARADALFEEGRALMASGDNEAACTKFEESQAMRPGIGTLFNLAECHEKIGKLVLAYREYAEVAERTKVALQADREKIARERLTALQSRVPRVVIMVPDDSKDAKVELDGQELPPAAWGVEQPIEPGEHKVRAQYGKKKPYEQSFTATAGDEPISITIGEEGTSSGSGGKRNTGLIVTGGILMGVGLIGVGIAASGADGNGLTAGQWISGISGLACIGVGVPLFIIGLKKSPPEGAAAASVDPLDAIAPGPVPAIGLGPTSASAAWRF